MDKSEAKSKIDEIVLYLLDTNDKDVVNHYSDMITDILEQYAQQVSEDKCNNCDCLLEILKFNPKKKSIKYKIIPKTKKMNKAEEIIEKLDKIHKIQKTQEKTIYVILVIAVITIFAISLAI
jgi:hypothetical protein